MRSQTAIATAVLSVALAAPADALIYEEGRLAFSVSGSWTATSTFSGSCEVATGPGKSLPRDYTAVVTERGTFRSGKGSGQYQGDVGREPFFLEVSPQAAPLRASVTRTVAKSVPCVDERPVDCGTKTVRGLARPEFSSTYRGHRPLSLHVSFGKTESAYEMGDPFKTCGAEAGGFFLDAAGKEAASPDWQGRALGYPRGKGFWTRKRLVMSGTTTTKQARFSMKMITDRKARVRKPSPRG